jgi:hypothetical protein
MRREHCGNFSVAHIVNERRGFPTGRGLPPPHPEGRRVAPEPVSEAFNRLLAEVRACTLCEPHREAGGVLSLGVKSNMTVLLRVRMNCRRIHEGRAPQRRNSARAHRSRHAR